MNRLPDAYRMCRLFTAAVAVLLLAAPIAAKAQPAGKIARVGILSPTTSTIDYGLGDLGWVEGRNLAFERRGADGQPDRLPALAADLLRANVDVIVAVSPPAIRAARNATRTVPIVMAFCGIDPVKAGFVASLARPGGNVTGLTHLQTDLVVKRLELLKEAVPGTRRVAVLVNPRNPSTGEQLAALKSAAPTLGVRVEAVEVSRSGEYANASMTIARTRPDGLIVPSDPEFNRDRQKIFELAAQTRTAASYEWPEIAEVGGFVAYGPNLPDLNRRAGVYVDKILKGAKPADLPVEQPMKFELVLNLKTAKALGLTIPSSLVRRADQLIE
jgi:putative ABC transport system substrate-binding protein